MEAFRQHMDQETPDELVGRQRHRLVTGRPFDPIILVLEGDAVVVGGHQPAIGDRDAVSVARQIAQHLAGPGEGLLGVDHPIDLAQWRQIGLECSLVGEPRMIAEELQAARHGGLRPASAETAYGTVPREPPRSKNSVADTRSTWIRPETGRHLARSYEYAGDASAPNPMCAAPI